MCGWVRVSDVWVRVSGDTFSMHVGECDSLVLEDLHAHPKVFQLLDPQHGVGEVLGERLIGWREGGGRGEGEGGGRGKEGEGGRRGVGRERKVRRKQVKEATGEGGGKRNNEGGRKEGKYMRLANFSLLPCHSLPISHQQLAPASAV